MATDALKKEAEEWLNKWELCNKCDHKIQCIEDNAFCPQVVERAYLASAEPREKQLQKKDKKISELEAQIEKMKCCANCKNYNCLCDCFNEVEQYCDKWEIAE